MVSSEVVAGAIKIESNNMSNEKEEICFIQV